MKKHSPLLPDDIVNAAISLAETKSWEEVRLADIATTLGTDLTFIWQYYREKDELIDAFFDRADQAMLKASAAEEIDALSSQQKLHLLLMAWFTALANHRRIVRQMIRGKLEPGHLHIQIPALLRVSRTVQWWREAAKRQATGCRRAIEESILTAVYLATFCYWLFDDSPHATATSHFLEKKLSRLSKLSHRLRCKKEA
ncbi:ubiquinone biosynthesis protein COQ9 [Aquicella lusitana]|uniref:TetR family transcriptional regulator n=1 Tax=Aquicella lusitana TaxID=254246 RepID=A0A370GLL1_9COXI|nr:TetR/AcrR family transcriptional regulator [Aquicella lusitana]RDI44537.1 TetR family transcriptional regulator [Aquicella lusitana]VVC72521.1 hypothetical protein AQULUS_02330 [Aquicella lusitana]